MAGMFREALVQVQGKVAAVTSELGRVATVNQGWRNLGFQQAKARLKMNKATGTPTLMGSDQWGNKYYEDEQETFGRNRWIEYRSTNTKFESGKTSTDWGNDASQVPAEWHGWLHFMNDNPPGKAAIVGVDGKAPIYKQAHTSSATGTTDRYTPPWHMGNKNYTGQYGEKVQSWTPPK